jgi:hypothetical protein
LLKSAQPESHWGHAKLGSIFLLPVLKFNLSRSPKVESLASQFGLDLKAVSHAAKVLFREDDYSSAMSVASQQWESIARDRCSRTNCVLVRRDSLEFFEQFRCPGVGA